jgi:ABC-2 type transport system permease protein
MARFAWGRQIWSLISMNGLLPMKRQPLYLINTLTSPFSFLFFIAIVGGAPAIPFGVAGGMILTILSIGTSLQTDLSHYKQDLKLQDMVVASPLSAGLYVSGMALSEFVYAIPGMTVFALLSVIYGHYVFLGGLAVVATLVLLWVFASALGFTLATYLADVRETFAVSPLISLALTVIPPVYYPISRWPTFLRPVAYVFPTTWAANLVQGALGISPTPLTLGGALLDAGVLLAAAVILFVLAWTKAQWRER